MSVGDLNVPDLADGDPRLKALEGIMWIFVDLKVGKAFEGDFIELCASLKKRYDFTDTEVIEALLGLEKLGYMEYPMGGVRFRPTEKLLAQLSWRVPC